MYKIFIIINMFLFFIGCSFGQLQEEQINTELKTKTIEEVTDKKKNLECEICRIIKLTIVYNHYLGKLQQNYKRYGSPGYILLSSSNVYGEKFSFADIQNGLKEMKISLNNLRKNYYQEYKYYYQEINCKNKNVSVCDETAEQQYNDYLLDIK